jgi:hypothetical protein
VEKVVEVGVRDGVGLVGPLEHGLPEELDNIVGAPKQRNRNINVREQP